MGTCSKENISGGISCFYSSYCDASCAGYESFECKEAKPVVIAEEEECSEDLSCAECLENDCAWAGFCLSSCDIIADVSCYDTNQGLSSPIDVCEKVAEDIADYRLCNSATTTEKNGCSICTQTFKLNNEPCVWIDMSDGPFEDSFCTNEGGQFGAGVTECDDNDDKEEPFIEEEKCPVCDQVFITLHDPVLCSSRCSYTNPYEAICAGFTSDDGFTLSALCVPV